ncbi:MAG: hypothetical protein HOC71_09215 [Candidatus Latescibacteria bacterium]|jgi:hypothetical protein|nr:hypothetical protein [Candidatus Latescibacterota bacterium]
MTNDVNLKKIEKDAYCMSNVQDGLYDIMFGLVFVVPALLSKLHLSDNFIIPVYAIFLLVFTIARRTITVPRVGHVKFGAGRIRKLRVVSAVLAASMASLFVLLFSKRGNVLAGRILLSLFVAAVIIMLVFSFLAYFMNNRRYYLYGVLFGVTIPLSRTLELYGVIQDRHTFTLFLSAVVLAIGLLTFIRFLRTYKPLIDGEV